MASWHQTGGIPLLLFLALTLLPAPGLSQTCAEYQTTLCTGGTLLSVVYGGTNITCDQELDKAQTAAAPAVTFPGAQAGQLYILIMTDPDAPAPCAPGKAAGISYLHYMAVMASQGGVLGPVNVSMAYEGPNPPSGTHRYQLQLFPMPQNATLTDVASNGRGGFPLQLLRTRMGIGSSVAQFQFKVPGAQSSPSNTPGAMPLGHPTSSPEPALVVAKVTTTQKSTASSAVHVSPIVHLSLGYPVFRLLSFIHSTQGKL